MSLGPVRSLRLGALCVGAGLIADGLQFGDAVLQPGSARSATPFSMAS